MTQEEQDVFVPFANGATVVAMPMPMPSAPPPPPAAPSAPVREQAAQDRRAQDPRAPQSQSQDPDQAPAAPTPPAPPAPAPPAPAPPAPAPPAPAPPVPTAAPAGVSVPEQLRADLHELFLHAGGQLQATYRAYLSHPEATTAAALLPFTDCATAGAVAGRLAVISAVFHGRRPGGPSTARQTAAAVRGMLKNAPDTVRAHLAGVLATLDELAGDPMAAQREDADLGSSAARLEETLRNSPGVYVYTYPHYWRHPYIPGTERRLVKVGRADFGQVRAQARQIGAPEDPLLLRVYVAAAPQVAERSFHRLLDAAEHTRGEEWFSTTLEFCDEIATALQLEILEADVPA